jgi:hypothetical protein
MSYTPNATTLNISVHICHMDDEGFPSYRIARANMVNVYFSFGEVILMFG